MSTANIILDILVSVAALTVVLIVGRDNIKKRTIKELQDLVKALTRKVDILQKTVGELRDENTELKETIDGYAELVREGYLAGGGRPRSRNRATVVAAP